MYISMNLQKTGKGGVASGTDTVFFNEAGSVMIRYGHLESQEGRKWFSVDI